MSVVDDVQARFVALARGVNGIATAIDHEPGVEGLKRRPCVTMLYRGPRRVGQSTGGVIDLDHRWDVYVYVDLSAGAGGYPGAERKLTTVLPRLLAAVQADFDLAGACELAALTDPEEQPLPDHKQVVMRKRLELRARKEEF